MRIGIALNLKKNKQRLVEEFVTCLQELNIPYCYQSQSQDFDILVCFGGDGTTLYYGRRYAGVVPIITVNAGTVGFLSQILPKRADFLNALTRLQNLDYKIKNCSLLQVKDTDVVAVNEMFICNAYRGNTVTVSAYLNDQFLCKHTGDGLIISTPVGSTAYSLSCNGSVLLADTNCFYLNPISTIGASNQIVYKDSDTLKLELSNNACLYADGILQDVTFIDNKVEIVKLPQTLQLITLKNDFFEKLRKIGRVE
ncbi:MAG: NAD(+)/NADH kinase [Clostridia bacterium]